MNRFITLLFIPFFLAADQLPHCKENDFMMVSLPRSGSTFLFNIICKANPQINSRNEFFNTVFLEETLEKYLGKPVERLHYTTELLPRPYLKIIYAKKWKPSHYNFTKEVLLYSYLEYFNTQFNLFALCRHRKHTFPTKDYYQNMYLTAYQYFINAKNVQNTMIKVTQLFLGDKVLSEAHKRAVFHIIASYTLLKTIANYPIEIIEYKKIMQLSGNDLKAYLQEKIPAHLYNNTVAELVERERIQDPTFLEKREQKYNELGIEPFCQKLITFMKTVDPDMPYWYLLE